MKKILKNIKGLSLSEVLVAISIVTVLSVYGISFFEAAWKYRADSDEYQTVLNNVASNLESSKYYRAVNKLFTTENLGSDKTAIYNVIFGVSALGVLPVTSNATVISNNNGSPATAYTITLASHVYGNWANIIYEP